MAASSIIGSVSEMVTTTLVSWTWSMVMVGGGGGAPVMVTEGIPRGAAASAMEQAPAETSTDILTFFFLPPPDLDMTEWGAAGGAESMAADMMTG